MNGSDSEQEKGTTTHEYEVTGTKLKSLLSFKWISALAALASLSAIAMLPLFLVGGSLRRTNLISQLIKDFIAADIGGTDSYTWLAIVYSLAFAAIAPFIGTLSDRLGRRYIAPCGPALIIVGMAVFGTAKQMPVAIGGMAIAGTGAGISQVIGIAGVAEIVPVKHRGKFIGSIYLLFTPMAPATTYGNPSLCSHLTAAQIYSAQSTWRWSAWISIGLSFISLVMVLASYHPPRRELSAGNQRLSITDYIGGILPISGIALFLLGLQWGGYN